MSMNLTVVRERAGQIFQKLHRFAVIGFLLLLLGVYGFLTYRIYDLHQIGPDENQVTAKLKTAGVPKIDEDALRKIEQLQDNSVEVKSLFDQARQNPFQE